MSEGHSAPRWRWLFTQRIAADTMPPPEWFLKDHPEYRAVGVFLDHDPSYKSPDIPGQWSLWQLDENRMDEKLQRQADDDGMRPILHAVDIPGAPSGTYVTYEPAYKDND